MGREVRKVPENWEHPKDARGCYIPLLENHNEWEDAEKTHLMMYENTSEGTPLSPAFKTPEELAKWLADNNASSFAGRGATYEQWLRVCQGGFDCSAIIINGKLKSGVEAL